MLRTWFLEVGMVPLEEMEVIVDVADLARFLDQEMDGPNAAWRDGPDPMRDLVMDVGSGHRRLDAFDAR